ncbi:MAG: NADH-quinone oxidoreductase subunit NuoK [Chloroflexia bacterium]
MSPPLEWYLLFSAALFSIGLVGVLVRRHVLIIFMSVELMLNACNVALVAFGRHLNTLTGQNFVVFVVTVAAAEAAVGLGLILALSRHKDTVDVGEMDILKH